jgi:MFS family permease
MSLASPAIDLLRREPRARGFFAAHAQSSLGTGAAYVALLVLAYERLHSPWAITFVLLADMVPPMVLGPLCGAAADRWSRRTCAVVADLLRAVAFLGIGLVPGFAPMLAFALLAGAGAALFRPAILAGLPSLVDEERLPAATSLYGALEDLGHTLGPVAAAGALVLAGPDSVMLANGATFAVSALVLMRCPLGGGAAAATAPGESLLRQAREGLHVAAESRVLRCLIGASSSILLFAGFFNVGELLLAKDTLGASSSGYSLLVAVFGLGVAAGSLTGSRGGSVEEIGSRYLAGLLLVAVAFVACGLAPVYWAALAAFAAGGVGNGLVMVHERLLLQKLVPDALMGRVFGVKDALTSATFGAGFVCAGLLLPVLDTRLLFGLAGAGVLAVWVAASLTLRPAWAAGSAVPAPAV